MKNKNETDLILDALSHPLLWSGACLIFALAWNSMPLAARLFNPMGLWLFWISLMLVILTSVNKVFSE